MNNRDHSYKKAFLWYFLSLAISIGNDVITKYVIVSGIAFQQVIFYRIVIGLIVLTLYVFACNPSSIYTKHLGVHIIRGGLFFIASLLWGYGLAKASVSSSTIISLTIPLFIPFFVYMLLKEKIRYGGLLASCLGFLGAMVIVFDFSRFFKKALIKINFYSMAFLIAALLFALIDVVNKKYITKESMLSMLFYSNLIAGIFGLPFLNFSFFSFDFTKQVLLLLLGLGGVWILFCLLKAYTYAPISWLSPLNYIGVPIAYIIDYVLFSQPFTLSHLIGLVLIIISSFLSSFSKE